MAEEEKVWQGLVFRVSKWTMLAPASSLCEILAPTDIVAVAGSKNWFLGLASLRGRIIPVTDLYGYMFTSESGVASTSSLKRILLVQLDGEDFGLQVDEVLGLQKYPASLLKKNPNKVPTELQRYVDSVVLEEELATPVIDLVKLISEDRFLDIQIEESPTE